LVLLLFEFVLVVLDPFLDDYSDGEPLIKLAFNLVVAALLTPVHFRLNQYVRARAQTPKS
jgi:hypothetical protein